MKDRNDKMHPAGGVYRRRLAGFATGANGLFDY